MKPQQAAILLDPIPGLDICEECGNLGGVERFETQYAQEIEAPPRNISLGFICDHCFDDLCDQDLIN